jgi:hypothetical protein
MCRSNVVDLSQGTTSVGRSRQLPSSLPLLLALAELTIKYDTLLALRVQREHLESNGVFTLSATATKARRRIAQALARQFPGALRELDGWNAAALAARLHDLADERARAYALPHAVYPERLWVEAVLAYHTVMRQALAARNVARARRLAHQPPTPRDQRFLAWHATSQGAHSPQVDAAMLARFAGGGGRTMVALVCEDVAAALDCQPDAVRQWVLGG